MLSPQLSQAGEETCHGQDDAGICDHRLDDHGSDRVTRQRDRVEVIEKKHVGGRGNSRRNPS